MSRTATALARLRIACVEVSRILDGGQRDPRWSETQELENAALEYGRAIRAAKKRKRAATGKPVALEAKVN